MALLSAGDRITDTLVIDRLLGEGAFAEVHRVRHEYLGYQALKLFKRVASQDETHAMLDEARLLSTLGHANIVRVFDANTVRTPEGLRGFFTMEYVPGGNLLDLAVRHRRTVPTALVVEIMEQIADGVAVAHDQDPPIVHRDLTLANALVGYDGTALRVRVSDFGLARRADPLTRLASAQGTVAFMAPEVQNNQGYSCASDVWSVGTVAYWLLTDRFPFDDGGFSSFSPRRFGRGIVPPSNYNDDVDQELDRIILATLELEPGNRPASARVLAEALRDRRRRLNREQRDSRGSRESGQFTSSLTGPQGERGRRLAEAALVLSKLPGELDRAADLMEEAIRLWPPLREIHLHRLQLWRKGVVM